MTSFPERFEQIIDYLDITPYKLAKEIYTSEAIISNIRGGKTKPSYDFLQKLLNKYKVLNANWIITGEGEMLLNKTSPASKDTRDGKNVEVGSEVISLLNKIEDEQKSMNANFYKLRAALELTGQPQVDKQKLADAAKQVDKIREQYASGELGVRNKTREPLVDKERGKKK